MGVYLSVVASSMQLYRSNQPDNIFTGIAWTLIGFFAIALRNSWNLLFEIEAEKQRRA